MDTGESYETNLNTIKEMILDEDKIVTYITVSKDLCIHVNSSKKILYSTVEEIRKEQPNVQLNISYIISGVSDSNTAITTICTEKDLKNIQKTLKIVYFYHVYSVGKGTPELNTTNFLLLNKYDDFTLCTGIIKNRECNKRTSDELGNLKISSQEAIVLGSKPTVISSKKLKQESKLDTKLPHNGPVKETNAIKQIEIKPEPNIKAEVKSPKKESNNKQISHKTNSLKSQKGIASFFNKSNGVQSKKLSNEQRDKKPTEEKMDIDNEHVEPVTEIKKEVIEKISKLETNCDKQKKVLNKNYEYDEKNKVLDKIKKSSKVDKKRKRVLHVSDSEGDDDNDPFHDNREVNNDSDDEIPPTPLANNIKITTGITNPKKRRKVVDRTYTDEDGFILTKKEEVYESCSEGENEDKKEIKEVGLEKETVAVKSDISPKANKGSPKKTKKKISPPQKGKQPTLNSFFQKK